MKVFVYDDIDLVLETGKNISALTTFIIKYTKPDGTPGRWAAALSGTTKVAATVNFTEDGIWRVQAFVKGGGNQYHGLRCDVRVFPYLATETTVPPTTAAP